MSRRIALFIGNSSYEDPRLTQLKTPAADVRELAATFRDPEIGGFDEVRELVDGSDAGVRRAIADLFARRHPEDLLLLYFSGHGVKDDRGRLYLAVRDTESHQLSATAVASSFITDQMDECRSKRQILILDCCNSGAFARGTKGGSTAMTADTFAGNGYGRVVLTASDATQYAFEGDRVIEQAELSLFTHYLLEGLRSGIPIAEEVITLDALYDHVYGRIVTSTPSQTPRKWVYSQMGALVLARNRGRILGADVSPSTEVRQEIQSPRVATPLAGADSRAAPRPPFPAPLAWFAELPPHGGWILASATAMTMAGVVNGALLGPALLAPGRNQALAPLTSGIIEGAVLAAALFLFFRTRDRKVDPRIWFGALIAASVIRMHIPILGWPYQVGAAGILVKGGLDGFLYGTAQVWALGLRGTSRVTWMAASIAAWIAVIFLFVKLLGLFSANVLVNDPFLPSLLTGALSGAVLGAITGFALPVLMRGEEG